MAGNMLTYDPEKVQLSIGLKTASGASVSYPIGGFADGTGIKVMRTTENYKKTTGMDGDTTRTRQLDKSGEIEITLAQTSPSNDLLRFVESSSSDGDFFSLTLEDTVNGEKYTSNAAWVQKLADAEFSKEVSNRTWKIECADLTAQVNSAY